MVIDTINKMHQLAIHESLAIHQLLAKSNTSISNEGEING